MVVAAVVAIAVVVVFGVAEAVVEAVVELDCAVVLREATRFESCSVLRLFPAW